jgi:hypothetical protein
MPKSSTNKTSATHGVAPTSSSRSRRPSQHADEFSHSLEAPSEAIELVFGFVAPTGVDFGKIQESLKAALRQVGYSVAIVRLSALIAEVAGHSAPFANEFDRIRTLMDEGTHLRESTGQRDFVARLGVAKIRELRKEATGSF